MSNNAGRRGGLAAAAIVALSTGSVALGAAGALSQGGGDSFLFVFVSLVLLAVLPIGAVTAAASAASSVARALAYAVLVGGVYGAVGGLALHRVVFSATCDAARRAYVVGGAVSGSLLAPLVVATWAPSILAAISARRSPTHDRADAVCAITAGWAAAPLVGCVLLAVLTVEGRTPWLLPIVAAALVDLAWWRVARGRIDRRIQTLRDARDGVTPWLTVVPRSAAPPGLVPFVRVAPPDDPARYDAALVEDPRSPTYRGTGVEGADWLGRVTADDAFDRHARATVRNFVTGPVRWFEIVALVVLTVGGAAAMVGWAWPDVLSEVSFRTCPDR